MSTYSTVAVNERAPFAKVCPYGIYQSTAAYSADARIPAHNLFAYRPPVSDPRSHAVSACVLGSSSKTPDRRLADSEVDGGAGVTAGLEARAARKGGAPGEGARCK